MQGWKFTSGFAGHWDVIDSGGSSVLRSYTENPNCRLCSEDDYKNEAILALDIQDDSNLALQFSSQISNQMAMEVSDNERDWYPVAENIYVQGGRTAAFDLSDAFARNGIEQQGVRFVKFSAQYQWASLEVQDIAVAPADVSGPWVAEHTFEQNADGNLETVEIVFDEPIDPETFTSSRIRDYQSGGRQGPTNVDFIA